MKKGEGAGVYGPNFGLSKPLGLSPSIFHAETHAIELCVLECLRRQLRRSTIYIMSDSQAALKVVSQNWYGTSQCSKSNWQGTTKLLWCGCQGHEGIEGNEAADLFARKGAETKFIGPEPFCGLPKSHTFISFKTWENIVRQAHWRNTPDLRQSKNLITISEKRAAEVLTRNKPELGCLEAFWLAMVLGCITSRKLDRLNQAYVAYVWKTKKHQSIYSVIV